jgi:Universal stress protein family
MNTQPHAIKRILVGVDGSDPSAAALAWATTMARGMGSEIVAVHAIDYPIDLSLGFGPPIAALHDPECRADIERTFEEEWCASLTQSGLSHRVMLEDGRPASVNPRRGRLGRRRCRGDGPARARRGRGAATGEREPRGGPALQAPVLLI